MRSAPASLLLLLAWLAPLAAASAATVDLVPGAAGADDTARVQRVIDGAAPGSTVDGGGRSFSIRGTLRIDRDLTLRNATFVQDSGSDAAEGRCCDRTLLIRGTAERPLRVVLSRVKVDRGAKRNQGSPGDAAGIWIDNVADSLLDAVEITGNGRGAGLLMADVRDVTVRDLRVHDMTWAPCTRQAEGLPYDAVRRQWNGYQVVSMRDCHRDDGPRERINEPLSGVFVVRSQGVRLLSPVVERLHAVFADGRELPWQTDGISVGSDAFDARGRPLASRMAIHDARISRVWEGIDLTGQPLTGVQVLRARVSDVHAFGIKVANGGADIVVRDSEVVRAGIAGFVVGGRGNREPPFPASHAVRIEDSSAIDTGAGGDWAGQAAIAGFRVMRGALQDPSDVQIVNARAVDRQREPTMEYGFLAGCRDALVLRNVHASGHRKAAEDVSPAACR